MRLLQESLLRHLAPDDRAPVNSHHHQAVETLGRELVATAWAADGMVEAIEDPRSDRFVLGVQWHPELGWERDEFARALFDRFVKEAAGVAERRATQGLSAGVAG